MKIVTIKEIDVSSINENILTDIITDYNKTEIAISLAQYLIDKDLITFTYEHKRGVFNTDILQTKAVIQVVTPAEIGVIKGIFNQVKGYLFQDDFKSLNDIFK